MSRYAQCACMGGIVDQVSHLMAYNFLALFRWGPVKGALNLLVVKDFFSLMVIDTNSRPKKPSENNVAQGFSMRCLGEQKGGNKKLKTKMHMNHLEMRYSMAMTFESKNHQHLSGCCVLQVFPQQVSHNFFAKGNQPGT